MRTQPPPPLRLQLGWLVPGIVLVSLWLNYSLANVDRLQLSQFAPISIQPNRLANYAPDGTTLAFAAANPQLFDQVLQESQEGLGRQNTPVPTNTQGTIAPTFTPGSSPTISPDVSPTAGSNGGGILPPLLPTIALTVPIVVPTQVVPALETLVPDLVPTILSPIVTQLPICIPLPPLFRCP